MNPIISIIEPFFAAPEIVRKRILDKGFEDVVSPVDQVRYPDICQLDDMREYMTELLSEQMMQPIKINFLFARVMNQGKRAPHKVHCDANMGKYSALIYLTPDEAVPLKLHGNNNVYALNPVKYGTGFYSHRTLGPRETALNTDLGQDHHSFHNWDEYLLVNAKLNRCLIYGSDYYHCAWPTEGFGNSYETGRMVLTVFFDSL